MMGEPLCIGVRSMDANHSTWATEYAFKEHQEQQCTVWNSQGFSLKLDETRAFWILNAMRFRTGQPGQA